MKRGGPLRRLTPLRARSSLRASPLARSAPERRQAPAERPGWREARAAVVERSGGLCEGSILHAGCTLRGEHVHHVVLRSRGGSDEPGNLRHLCHRCHEWVHRHPAQATGLGLMASREETSR